MPRAGACGCIEHSAARRPQGAALNKYGNSNHERESCKYRRGGRTWRASRTSMETLITSGSHANTAGVVEPGVHLADHTSGTARLCGDDVTEYECVTGDDRHHDPNGLVVGGVTGAAVLGDGCREQVRPSMKLGMNRPTDVDELSSGCRSSSVGPAGPVSAGGGAPPPPL